MPSQVVSFSPSDGSQPRGWKTFHSRAQREQSWDENSERRQRIQAACQVSSLLHCKGSERTQLTAEHAPQKSSSQDAALDTELQMPAFCLFRLGCMYHVLSLFMLTHLSNRDPAGSQRQASSQGLGIRISLPAWVKVVDRKFQGRSSISVPELSLCPCGFSLGNGARFSPGAW